MRRYGKVGKRVWTKDAHGGAYRISTGPGARGGYDALEQLPDGRPRDVDPGYEKPATGPTTNFVGNHMTQGAIDLAQNALSRPDPDAEARLARLEAARGVHRKPPQKLPPALPPPIDPIDETDGDAPNVGSKNVGSKEDVRRVPVERYAWRDGGDRVFVTLEPRRHLPPGADLDAAEARFERDAVTLEVPVRDDDARRPGRLLPGPRARSETSDEKSALVAVAALRVRLANAIDPDRSAMTVDGGVARLELAKADPGVEWERLRREAPRREALGDAKDASRDSTDLAAVRRELIRRREGRLAERMAWLREPAPAALPEPETDDALAASEEGDDDERPWEDVEAEVFAEAEEAARRGAHDEAEAAWSRALRAVTRRERRAEPKPEPEPEPKPGDRTKADASRPLCRSALLRALAAARSRAHASRADSRWALGNLGGARNDYGAALAAEKRTALLSEEKDASSTGLGSPRSRVRAAELAVKRGRCSSQLEAYDEACADFEEAIRVGGARARGAAEALREARALARRRAATLEAERRRAAERRAAAEDDDDAPRAWARPGMRQFENRGKAGSTM